MSTKRAPREPAVPLYAYQERWFRSRGRFKIGMFSRQVGKTFTSTLEIVDDCMEAEAHGRKARWVILSRGERQAKEAMLEGIHRHLKAYGMAFKGFEYDWGDEVKYKALEVVLPGGSRITALPANPDTARGFSANVLLDEFAFHKDSSAIWKALYPCITRGYRIIVISTPNGKNNKFHELMTGKSEVWYRQTVDIYQAAADGYPVDVAELREGLNDEDAWAQEYELQWLDEATSWLSYDLIASCEHEDAGKPELYQDGPCYVGVDIARRRDLWVAWVDELVGDVRWCREIRELKGKKFSEHDAALAEIMATYRVLRVCMDQTGMGEKPVEDAKDLYGEDLVEGVLFTGPNKLVLATLGKQAFEDRRRRIPAGNDELRRDLHKLKKETGPTGAPRFVAERDGGGHADRAWAAFLADNAAESKLEPFDGGSTGIERSSLLDEDRSGYAITEDGWGTVAGGLGEMESY